VRSLFVYEATLIDCIAEHIPYRNSKLTHLLSTSLVRKCARVSACGDAGTQGGTAKVLMFVNVAPSFDNVQETLRCARAAREMCARATRSHLAHAHTRSTQFVAIRAEGQRVRDRRRRQEGQAQPQRAVISVNLHLRAKLCSRARAQKQQSAMCFISVLSFEQQQQVRAHERASAVAASLTTTVRHLSIAVD
jgi:hypothetical protein